jgi:hypothetical protein
MKFRFLEQQTLWNDRREQFSEQLVIFDAAAHRQLLLIRPFGGILRHPVTHGQIPF